MTNREFSPSELADSHATNTEEFSVFWSISSSPGWYWISHEELIGTGGPFETSQEAFGSYKDYIDQIIGD